ncbi:hypothetical protein DFJ74DRAFT_374504 [Hyaloraphidium curvatum]|nr:hypothetical protein DFJ74DRAFT_374504 [Hyaloraphidium curvatum]
MRSDGGVAKLFDAGTRVPDAQMLTAMSGSGGPAASSKGMQKLAKETINRLSSAQVIVSLESAVKELIENSIDAGATTIEVRFRDHGLGGVEVRDNGGGIAVADHELLAARSSTSKIREFEDVEKVESYGFRGEALSALASMSELSVTTATDPPLGHKLDYDQQGNLASKTPLARDKGTTVSFKELFKPFPVRLAEFKRNAKREYAKTVALIQAYALIRTDVRFMCSNQIGKERPAPVFSTQASRTMRDNIAAVFGAGVADKLVAVDAPLGENGASVVGFVSKVTAGSGRNTSDRVFFWVNRRPCELPKFSRAINESYRLFSQQQYPMVFLDVVLPPDSYDVNVSPDKRTILLHDETTLVEALKAAMTDVFERSGTEYQSTQAHGSGSNPSRPAFPAAKELVGAADTPQPGAGSGRPPPPTVSPPVSAGSKAAERSASSTKSGTPTKGSARSGGSSKAPTPTAPKIRTIEPTKPGEDPFVVILDEDNVELADTIAGSMRIDHPRPGQKRKRHLAEVEEVRGAGPTVSWTVPGSMHLQNSVSRLECSLDRIRLARQARAAVRAEVAADAILDKSEITADSRASEEILTKHISKDDFSSMAVIGQFNLGFIIVKLLKTDPASGASFADLFIVDQHASDEKYNYEQLGAELAPNVQMMLVPQPLSLSSTEQLVVVQHLDLIQRNGFQISVDESADPSKRFQLRGVPSFGGIALGLPDLEDLVSRLADSGGGKETVRPTKIERILASKACRKSVMIGDSLPRSAMEKIVRNMGKMRLPWNCPHGRPTMRHLCSLADEEAT